MNYRCICVRWFEGKREVLMFIHPRCPKHGGHPHWKVAA